MRSMMPNDVKPAKIKSIATTNIDELRNRFRHARGYLRYHNIIPEEQRGVYMVSSFLEGPLSKCWYSQVAQTRDEVGGARRRRSGGGPGGGCARRPVCTYLYLHAVGAGNPIAVPCLAR
jgi:hypothetical protein